MRTQSPLAGLQTAEQLINNYCDGDSATQLQSNPAHNAATSHPHGASLAPQTDLIESLAIANAISPKSLPEPPLDSKPELSPRADPEWTEDHDRT